MNQFDNKSINFNKKTLCIAIGYVILGGGFSTGVGSAVPNDLNTYKQPTEGQTTILLMLDSTANMDDNYDGIPRAPRGNTPAGAIYADYPECRGETLNKIPSNVLDLIYGKQATNTLTASSANSTFPPNPGIPYCGLALTPAEKALTLNSTTSAILALKNKVASFKYSRMDRMKIAMSMLLSDSSIDNKVSLGLGQFSTATPLTYKPTVNQANNSWISGGYLSKWTVDNDSTNGHKDGNDISAKILIANKQNIKDASGNYTQFALDNDQRFLMRAAVGVMGSGGRTPLASALAESGAYMLASTTLNSNGQSPGIGISQFTFDRVLRGPYSYSGFNDSNSTSKSGKRYSTPIPTAAESCNASGIFLLSNGVPTETPRSIAQSLMQNALNDTTFVCPVNNTGGLISATGTTDYGWTCMGAFAKKLYSPTVTTIPQVKVAVAGFGNNFIPYLTSGMSKTATDSNGKTRLFYKCNALTTGNYTYNGQGFIVTNSNIQDVKNSCNLGELSVNDTDINFNGVVGGYGQGGFYPIVEASQLADSIKSFVADLQTSIPSLNSGLPAIPTDTLNTTQQLPFAYYSQFQPDTRSSQAVGIWVGNIKKFQAFNNTFKDKNSNNIIDTNGNLASTTDFWSISTDGANAISGGVSAKLPVQTVVGRKIYTNRSVTGSTVSEITAADTALTLIASNNTTATTGTAEVLRASSDPDKAYLLNLLGFGISISSVPAVLTNANQLRQMGATINSTPVAFTTQSKIATKASGSSATLVNVGDYINRKDYILFGTAQGLLQVVDSSTGEEKFSFLPKEMIDRQKQGFIAKSLQSTLPNFYSGIDGAWSVYANYVTNDESNSLKADTLNVYGGLRRGGANYYGLDLKNIETGSPKILFKTLGTTAIDPITGIPTGACSNTTPLTCMGQSWSKPTIGWVKWKGKPQLVMIVGGGYDPVYDTNSYKSDTTATKGNGVYMFAANTNTDTGLTAGALMWWGSSSATATAATATEAAKTTNSNLKYSVVSEIKAIDRDSDGFIDNLYFGDLGGQVFRVDINNLTSTATTLFDVKRIVRIGNFVADTERAVKTAPRFYSMPTFTVHRIGDLAGVINATRFAVISVGSGDQSNPVLNSLNDLNGMPDRVYGIFDKDIGREDLYSMLDADTTSKGLLTGTAEVSNMLDLAVTTAATTGAATLANMQLAETKGWFNTLAGSTLGTTATSNLDPALTGGIARFKVLSKFTAIKNTLFTSYFDAADNGSSTSCSAGIKGRSYIKNYCLPFGSMGADGMNCGAAMDGRLYSGATAIGSDVGAGVIPVIIGGMNTSGGTAIGPLAGKVGAVSAQYKTPLRFEPLKWSEKNS